jgi:hypothetical protein
MSTTQQVYSIDDMYTSINDIYSQFDQGKITVDEARELMLLCSKEFVQHNNLSMLNALKSMGKLEIITVGK